MWLSSEEGGEYFTVKIYLFEMKKGYGWRRGGGGHIVGRRIDIGLQIGPSDFRVCVRGSVMVPCVCDIEAI